MIQKYLSLFILFSICFLSPVKSEAQKKRKVFPRKWSLSLVNAYRIHGYPEKPSGKSPFDWGDVDGPMHLSFSALEISRNFGYYEIGAKIQNSGPAFVSPFFKWNANKNNSKALLTPSVTVGVVPTHILGIWLRLSYDMSLNSYISIAPFIAAAGYYEIKDIPKYAEKSIYFNAGIRINLYY